VPTLYRVLPYLKLARKGQPGHPLHVPASTGSSRVDNPELYDTLYLGDSPLGAVAEAFGWAARWNAGLLRGSPAIPGSTRALVSYDLPDHTPLCDLDDAERLQALTLRPSQVVTRDRSVTQGWARAVYALGQFAGVRWWSYYNPEWGSLGMWDTGGLTVRDVAILTVEHEAFVAAAADIVRIVD
jgi:hypothetical protein